MEILVKFNDDKTTITINENIKGKMILKKIGIMTPGITSVLNIDFYNFNSNNMKDYVTTYLYVKFKLKFFLKRLKIDLKLL